MIFIWEHAQLPSQVIQLQKRRQLLVSVHDELSAIATVGAGNVDPAALSVDGGRAAPKKRRAAS
jgi:hypothetical protein